MDDKYNTATASSPLLAEEKKAVLPVQLICETCWDSSKGKESFKCECGKVDIRCVKMLKKTEMSIFGKQEKDVGLSIFWTNKFVSPCCERTHYTDEQEINMDFRLIHGLIHKLLYFVGPLLGKRKIDKCTTKVIIISTEITDHIAYLKSRWKKPPSKYCQTYKGTTDIKHQKQE